MAYADWTFSGTFSLIAGDFTDLAPSSLAPSLSFRRGTASGLHFIYPTAGTVNGISTQGLNEGRIETWFKILALGAVSRQFGLNFRATNTDRSSYTGYSFMYRHNSGGTADARFDYYSSGTPSAVGGFSATSITDIAADTWVKLRVSWWEAGNDLLLTAQLDYNDGAGFVTLINSQIDAGNASRGRSSTNYAFVEPRGSNTANTDYHIDSTAYYRL